MDDIKSWFYSQPKVTRSLFVSIISCTLLVALGFINPNWLTLIYRPVFYNFEIWRVLTCFIIYPLGLPFLMDLMFLIRYGSNLEKDHFQNRSSDFLMMVIFLCSVLLIPGFITELPLLGPSLIMSIIYVWARFYPELTVTFMFGLRFKSKFTPWVLVGFSFLMGGNPMPSIYGIVAGHIYYLLVDRIPRDYGYNLLKTPDFIKSFFPDEIPAANVANNQPPADAGPRGLRYAWGTGQRLGTN